MDEKLTPLRIVVFVCVKPYSQESVVLARWLMGITMALAAQRPNDQHAQSLVLSTGFDFRFGVIWCSYMCNISLPSLPRLRAAVFVNLVGMRATLSNYMGPVMPEDNIRRLGDSWAVHECTCFDHVCYSVDPMSN